MKHFQCSCILFTTLEQQREERSQTKDCHNQEISRNVLKVFYSPHPAVVAQTVFSNEASIHLYPSYFQKLRFTPSGSIPSNTHIKDFLSAILSCGPQSFQFPLTFYT